MIRVRFGGFSVLKITKGLRANWVDKLSHFGGTAGLFTGVSYITLFEILSIIAISIFMTLTSMGKKVQEPNDVEAQKCQSKEYENEIQDLKKKLDDDNAKKFDALEKRLIVHDYAMIEDNPDFETYKKELDILKNKVVAVDAMNIKMMEILEKLMVDMKKLMGGKE